MEQQKQTQGEGEADTAVVFGVEDVPPVHLTILFGLQVRIHVLYTYFYICMYQFGTVERRLVFMGLSFCFTVIRVTL